MGGEEDNPEIDEDPLRKNNLEKQNTRFKEDI